VGRIWKEVIVVHFTVPFWYKQNMRKPTKRIMAAGKPTETPTRYLSNTIMGNYNQNNKK
jgi:hypothetical protein